MYINFSQYLTDLDMESIHWCRWNILWSYVTQYFTYGFVVPFPFPFYELMVIRKNFYQSIAIRENFILKMFPKRTKSPGALDNS